MSRVARKKSIHDGLNEADVRDFLVRGYHELYNETSRDLDDLEEQLKKQISLVEEYKRLIRAAKKRDAFDVIVQHNGWMIHDTDPDEYETLFIGTNDEYEDWIESMQEKDEQQIEDN